MTNINIELISDENKNFVKHLEEQLFKRYKTYKPETFFKLAVVSTNDITIGMIGIIEKDGTYEVHLFQAPAVCRMSVLSLIEASVHLVQKLIQNNIKQVLYSNIHYTLVFKIQQMIPNSKSVDDFIVLDSLDILNTDLTKVSLKRVYFENL